MRRWLGRGWSVVAFWSLGAAPPPASSPVEYRLSPVVEQGAIVALGVTVRFAGDASGTTRFAWPTEWAGERHLGRWARDIAVSGARSVEAGADGARTIHAAPGAAITVRYRIVSAYAADPSVDDSRQPAPVVRPGWFYGVGEALFARPEGGAGDDRPARFTWAGHHGIGFASDLQHGGGRTTLHAITESIVIGGRDLHLAASGPPGRQVRVARVGGYAFDGAAFDALALKVIAAERDFWRARDEGPFLVTMTPVASRPNHYSYGGTGRGDGFALWMDGGAPLGRLAWLLGHEYFHTWNDDRLGTPMPDPQERGYWFSEGLTDFYASRLMLRAGLISPEQFAAKWNEALLRYARSRFRTAPNDEVAAKFWSDREAKDMQYQRGAILAALWDRRLKLGGTPEGLDTVLRAQAARLPAVAERPTAIDLFIETARDFRIDVRPDVDAHVEHGEPLLLPVDSFGPCARVVTGERPVFALGWDVAATRAAGNVVTGLDRGSPAFAAGLRNGMALLGRVSGDPDDARVDYAVRVADATEHHTIRFSPAGKAHVTTQELVLDRAAFAATPEACRRSLAG